MRRYRIALHRIAVGTFMAAKKKQTKTVEELRQQLVATEKRALPAPQLFPVLARCHELLTQAYDAAGDARSAYHHVTQSLRFMGFDLDLELAAAVRALDLEEFQAAAGHWMRGLTSEIPEETMADIVKRALSAADLKGMHPRLQEVIAKIVLDHPETLPRKTLAALARNLGVDGQPEDVALALSATAMAREASACFFFRAKAAVATKNDAFAEAAEWLERYVAVTQDPFVQARAVERRVQSGAAYDPRSLTVTKGFPSATAYYNAGVIYQGLRRDAEPGQKDTFDALAVAAYDQCIQRCETHFNHRDGTTGDANLHVYSMCCRNYAMLEWNRDRFDACVELHTKGIGTSPFYEHFNERSNCYYKLGKMKEAGDDSAVVLTDFAEIPSAEMMLIHHYRFMKGTLESGDLTRSVRATGAALEYVSDLSPNERKALDRKTTILFELAAEIFERSGDARRSADLKNRLGKKGEIQAEVKDLLTRAAELCKQQKYAESLPLWEAVNALSPRNIDALNWRLWIMATLKNQGQDAARYGSLIESISEQVVDMMVTSSPEWVFAPKRAIIKGYESALGNLAWQALEQATREAQLLTAVTMVDEATHTVFDYYRTDDIRHLLDTKARLLLKLQRADEAYTLVHRVLSKDPDFADFQEFKTAEGYLAWERAGAKAASVRLPRYITSGTRKHELRPVEEALLCDFAKETVAAFHAFKKSRPTRPQDEGFDGSPGRFDTGRAILALSAEQKRRCVTLCFERNKNDLPEFGLLDNLQGEEPVHHHTLQFLCGALFEQDLGWAEEEWVALLRTDFWRALALDAVLAWSKKHRPGPALAAELTRVGLLAEPDEKKQIEKILRKSASLH